MVQEFGGGFAVWFWPRVSHKVGQDVVWVYSHLKASLGAGSPFPRQLTLRVAGKDLSSSP